MTIQSGNQCIRSADLELAAAVIEKERLITAGALHSDIMAQDAVIEEKALNLVRRRGIVPGQLTLGTP